MATDPNLSDPKIINGILKHLLKYWYLLLFSLLTGCIIGYIFVKQIKPVYSATINFVLSSEQKPSSVSSLATQMGFDIGGGADNIFSGDNIIDFFKSRTLIGKALLTVTDTATKESLLNLIIRKHFATVYATAGKFGPDPKKYSSSQTVLYRSVISMVSSKFAVVKKDKRLIFYLITASDTDPDVAFYIAKNMLQQTSSYFIETKTKVSAESVRLMKHEADSLSKLLASMYTSTAATADRTFNLNPSLSVQRSGIQITQSRVLGVTQAYQQISQSLENAKMSLQRETPLYRVIDTPELPLAGVMPNIGMHVVIAGFLALLIMSFALTGEFLYQNKNMYNAKN